MLILMLVYVSELCPCAVRIPDSLKSEIVNMVALKIPINCIIEKLGNILVIGKIGIILMTLRTIIYLIEKLFTA